MSPFPFPTYASTSKRLVVDDQRGGVVHLLPRESSAVRSCTSVRGLGLQARIERGDEAMLRGILRAQRLQQMRREVGQVVRLGGERLGQRQVQIQRRQVAGRVQPAQQRSRACACSRSRLRLTDAPATDC